MRIGLDASYSLGQNLSGVGVYSREILFRLPLAHPEARYVFSYRPHRWLESFHEKLPAGTSRSLLWRGFPRSLSLFHALNQRIDAGRFQRAVATFHDLFVMTGEYSTPGFRTRFAGQARAAADRADLIITVSQFTADQVQRLLHVEPGRIRVIPHGCGVPLPGAPQLLNRARQPAPGEDIAPEPVILFVGAIQKRKNVIGLVKAFERTGPEWRLILAGSYGYGSEEALAAIEASPRRRDIAVPGYVSREALEQLYRRASIFAFPSFDEGFGMPVLEAMSRGVPVLTSNGSALREVAGDAAWLVDPHDPDSMAEGLVRVTENSELRKELSAKGRARSREFSWEQAVESTWGVYRELTG